MLSRGQVQSLKPVGDFIESRSRKSPNTGKGYLTALVHFNNFLSPIHTAETILHSLIEGETDVYKLLDSFVSDQLNKVAERTTVLHLAGVKSYLEYQGIDILPKRFKNRVTLPEIVTDDEQAIDAQDIRMLLLKCSNRRLKAYLLVLASGGMRTVEALAIRITDIDFTVRPTKIHIRAGYSKTRRARDIYISNEATQTLRERINWKNGKTQTPDDLVFQDYAREKNKEPDPRSLYYDIAEEFSKLLELAGFVERKESRSKRPRHKITLHSIRRFVKTAISEVASTDFSEWFLGHKKSSYWTVKEAVKSEIYATKCMKYLTFLD